MTKVTSLCQELYYGLTPRALRARSLMLLADLMIICYFVATTFVPLQEWIVIADMAIGVDAAALLIYRAAWTKDQGAPRVTREASMAKLFTSELAMRATTNAVQLLGADGYSAEYPVERMMRDAKICEIGEGTSEVQRLVIARSFLRESSGN